MNEASWLPGIVVLAAGLLIGLSLAFKLRGQRGKQTQRESKSSDLRLRIRDLEARRDDLYRRIRAAEEDKLGADEIAALEDTAAHTLRELDRYSAQLPGEVETTKSEGEQAAESATAVPTPEKAKTRNPVLVGFAFGAAMVAVVALLVYWAIEDAQPTAPMGSQPTQAGATMEPPHEGQQEIPPEIAAQIADLQNRLVTDPGDWTARKQLALTYVASGQYFEAFSQASQVLQQSPEDPDGLLVHGIVRLSMGQADQAVGLFDQVLAQYPDHRQALIYRGLALYQIGKVEQAIDTWDMGRQMLGGSDPELDELIGMARAGASRPAGMVPTSQEPDPDGYSLTLELAPGARIPPQATLFIFLLSDADSPPVAARRISEPRFPLAISLGVGDSMMGAELPDSGTLVARLDTDGNIATNQAGDLSAEIHASKGQLSRVTLGQ